MKATLHLKTAIIAWVRGPIRCRALARVFLTPTHISMKTKIRSQSGFLASRGLIALLFCVAASSVTTAIPTTSGLDFFSAATPAKVSHRTLTFEERVAYQRAIEDVYWRHRIWPNTNGGPKPPLDAVMSQAQLERKVEGYLRNSQALKDSWEGPITAEQLQAEMGRMAQHTRQPEVLHEIFEALGNDPFVIAECLARPVLSDRLQLATVEWRKEPLQSDSAKEGQEQIPNEIAAANANYALPAISDQPSDCVDDNWMATSTTSAPTARSGHTAVWTGSEMIVWGGDDSNFGYLNTGGRYNPATDSWTATSTTNAPRGRYLHTAVWTGSEMIVWGGYDCIAEFCGYANSGGRYNPSADSWTATSTSNAPSARGYHTAVWTGSEMIIWGGTGPPCNPYCSFFNTGGRYNPSTDTWTATSTINAPTARVYHTAVWADSEMIIWGGGINGSNTGGRYNPSTDSWIATSTSNAPSARYSHTAIWTGSEMIVWGGLFSYLKTGGRYNPRADSWTNTNIINAPTGRSGHTAVWTGSEMIIWGGIGLCNPYCSSLNTGGRYNPNANSWTNTSTTNAPEARSGHTAVWTESEMIVWGGGFNFNTGSRYCAAAVRGPITLSAAGRKVGGINTVRLTWDGATSSNIDVYRNNVLIATTTNTGTYTDSTGDTGRARYTYRVCEAGTQTCSNDVTVRFQH
jgi:N-acetylneuraminic acid mutarotase